MFVDTHCHIFDEYYLDVDEVINKLQDSGISKIISNGCNNSSNHEVLDKSKKYINYYCALGIHPEDVNNYSEDDLDFIVNNLDYSKVVAIGEIGLDYHYDGFDKTRQISLFEKQLAIAEKYKFPVIIHSRDAIQDTLDILKKYKVTGVIHSFSGSYEMACEFVKLGFCLGVNGVVTFKNCKIIDTISKIGLENIVLETDSPYLTPVPYRGERNDPSRVMDIAKFISDNLNISLKKLEIITNDNVKRIFDI